MAQNIDLPSVIAMIGAAVALVASFSERRKREAETHHIAVETATELINPLRAELSTARKELKDVRGELEKMRVENLDLRSERAELLREIRQLRHQVDQLSKQLTLLGHKPNLTELSDDDYLSGSK